MGSTSETITTNLTQILKIKYPILLAGMNGVSNGEMAAAVTNAGGLGVIGGVTLTPKALRADIASLKAHLKDKNAPFGVDLLLPKVGGNARKTNKDYTGGKLGELVDIIIEEKASLFVSAVGVPPKWVVDKFHAAGIVCGNMVGAPHHAVKAVEAGMDFVIAQGGEAGGHTGEIGTLVLIRQVKEAVQGKTSKLTGKPIAVCAAGGIADGEAVAAALALGAEAVWVGTRFIACTESAASQHHINGVLEAKALDTQRTLVFSGRPMRGMVNDYVRSWEVDRKSQIQELCDQGIVPFHYDLAQMRERDEPISISKMAMRLMGQCAGHIHDVKSAEEIVQDMMTKAIATIRRSNSLIAKL